MAKTQKKSTKKFEKKHLKDVLENRKNFAKIKQRHQKKDKKRARREKENAAAVEDGERANTAQRKKDEKDRASEAFKEMTVDDFFAGGFEVPEINGKKAKKVTGKRKRESDDELSDVSVDLDRVESDSEAGDASEAEQEGHKGDLEALKEKDPEFYKYLQENDSELLDFDDDALAALSDEEIEEQPKKKKAKAQEKAAKPDNEVTSSMIKKWENLMVTQHSSKATREIILAFRSAVHTNEETKKTFKYTISNPQAYHELLTVALKQIPKVIQHHIPIKEAASGKVKVPTDSKKFKTLAPLIMAYANALTVLLGSLSDDGTIKLTLGSVLSLSPYLLSFKKLLKNLVKITAEIWSDSGASETVRMNAFLIIRRLAIIGDAAIKETLLKTAYQGLVKGSRNTTQHTLSGINLMKNSAVDLWGCDAALAYTTGFTYIRQLAIHLRTTLTKPTKDSYKAIYNWQYVHSLDFWSRTLSTHCSPEANTLLKKPQESPLFPLIYPLVQVTLGALRLIPTPTYFPLRFHLTRFLLRISRFTGTYIPLAPALIEVLQSPEVRDPAKPSTIKSLDFSTTLRAPKQYIRTRVYQDGIIEQVSELLAEFFGIWAKSVAFPELIIPPVVWMKKWMKDLARPQSNGSSKKKSKKNNNPKLLSSINLLLQKLNLNAEFIERHRQKLEFAPKDRAQLDNFLKDLPIEDTPMGGFVDAMRKRNEAQRRVLEESRQEDEKARQRQEPEEDVRMVNGIDDEAEEDEEEDEELEEDIVPNGAKLNGIKANGHRRSPDDSENSEDDEAREEEENEYDLEDDFIDDESISDGEEEDDDDDDE